MSFAKKAIGLAVLFLVVQLLLFFGICAAVVFVPILFLRYMAGV